MKTITTLVTLLLLFTLSFCAEAQKKGIKTVVFHANLHCESCKTKLEKNIPFEKGVKDLQVNLKEKTVTISFREDKNTTENLQKAIEKLNIAVTGLEGQCCTRMKECNKMPCNNPNCQKNCCSKNKEKR